VFDMGVVVPQELVWVLDVIGVSWPNINEDDINEVAGELRKIAADLESGHGDAHAQIEALLGVNSSESLALFEALWRELSDGHLRDLAEGLKVFADVLEAVYGVIIGLKTEAVAHLGILAGQLIFDQAAAIETLGASEAQAAGAIAVCRVLVNRLLHVAIDRILMQLRQAVEGPIFDALKSAGANLAGQLLGDALGIGHGLDFSALESAAVKGGEQGLSALRSQASSAVSNPSGSLLSLADGTGLPGANDQATVVGRQQGQIVRMRSILGGTN
jgi:hypothetical protein